MKSKMKEVKNRDKNRKEKSKYIKCQQFHDDVYKHFVILR